MTPGTFGRGALFLRDGCSCRRRRNIGHARGAARPGSFQLQSVAQPSGTFSGGTAHNRDDTGWQGYLSSPARATAAYGRAVEAWWIEGTTDLMLCAVRGENLFVHARRPETVPAVVTPMPMAPCFSARFFREMRRSRPDATARARTPSLARDARKPGRH
jgi:hypothetical protein